MLERVIWSHYVKCQLHFKEIKAHVAFIWLLPYVAMAQSDYNLSYNNIQSVGVGCTVFV